MLGVLILLGCTHKRIGNDSLVEYRTDKILDSVATFFNDTILHGYKKKYYKDGITLRDSMPYNMGKRDGIYISYFRNGKVQSKCNLKNDLPDGMTYWFYENGNKKSESYWIQGKQFGNAKFYFSDGNLDTYNFYDFQENVRYIKKYSEDGKVIKDEGSIIGQLLLEQDSFTVKMNKEIGVKICVSEPPDTKTTVFIGETNKQMKITNLKEYPINEYTVKYNRSFSEPGQYVLVTIGELEDLKTKRVKRDSLYTTINVIK